jgi:hypothetical protein
VPVEVQRAPGPLTCSSPGGSALFLAAGLTAFLANPFRLADPAPAEGDWIAAMRRFALGTWFFLRRARAGALRAPGARAARPAPLASPNVQALVVAGLVAHYERNPPPRHRGVIVGLTASVLIALGKGGQKPPSLHAALGGYAGGWFGLASSAPYMSNVA